LKAQEIFEKTKAIIEQYIKALKQYDEQSFFRKKDEQTWSVGQLYQHLYSSSTFFLYQTKNCIAEKKGSTEGTKNEYGEKAFYHHSFPPIKIKMPDVWNSGEIVAQNPSDYQRLFPELIAMVSDLIEVVNKDDGHYKANHAAWGMLTAIEWFEITEMHFRHHLRQVKELNEFLGIEN
jgi:DinB superfamily